MSRMTIISTVGTSMLFPNLKGLKADDPDPMRAALAIATENEDWQEVAEQMANLSPSDRLCGAEINSLASLLDKGYAAARANLFFAHSATKEGRGIATVLKYLYLAKGHPRVETIEIDGLQDENPTAFRTTGLRNLARQICRLIREYDASSCALNATGGYKAQIAVAVLIGQAVGVPVYYKHERFDEIIEFPPMPVSFDFTIWLEISEILELLARNGEISADAVELHASSASQSALESLVERVSVDGRDYLGLTATGQIFHETFRSRFRHQLGSILPPQASEKKEPQYENAGWPGRFPGLSRYFDRITQEVGPVIRCRTYYFNPDLSSENHFRVGAKGLEGIFSDGSKTVKFAIDSTAETPEQLHALKTYLNQWLDDQ